MAAALMRQAFGNGFVVASAGVRKGELDGFAIAAMTRSASTSRATSR